MPMIATTIISSISVKPFSMCFIKTSLLVKSTRGQREQTMHEACQARSALSDCFYNVEKVTVTRSGVALGRHLTDFVIAMLLASGLNAASAGAEALRLMERHRRPVARRSCLSVWAHQLGLPFQSH